MSGLKPEPKLFTPVPFSWYELSHGEVTNLHHDLSRRNERSAPITVVVLDVETTSSGVIDYSSDKVIEICLVKVTIDKNTGHLLSIDSVLNQLIDPGFELSEETTGFTGITTDDVIGKSFSPELTKDFLNDVSLVVAHYAKFDRGMVSGLTTIFDEIIWACSCKGDVNWRDHGYTRDALDYLLFKNEQFYNAHRAGADCFALVELLRLHPKVTYELLQSAQASSYEIRAIGAPYAVKDALKSLGYSPLYDDQGNWAYWYKSGLNKYDAEVEFQELIALYSTASKDKCLIEIPAWNKYKLNTKKP